MSRPRPRPPGGSGHSVAPCKLTALLQVAGGPGLAAARPRRPAPLKSTAHRPAFLPPRPRRQSAWSPMSYLVCRWGPFCPQNHVRTNASRTNVSTGPLPCVSSPAYHIWLIGTQKAPEGRGVSPTTPECLARGHTPAQMTLEQSGSQPHASTHAAVFPTDPQTGAQESTRTEG